MAEFDLLAGHPWEHHAQSPATTYYACLSALASHSRPRRILEIGTGFGLSAAALLSACETVELFISLDLGIFADHYHFPENNQAFAARKAHAWCKKRGIPPERVRFFKANTQPPGKSDNDNLACQAPHWRDLPELQELLQPGSFDVLFVDGKHTEDGLYQDMLTFWEFLRPGGLLQCDDLHDASYRDIFPWAGDTLTSFQRFTTEQAGDIEEHHIWPYPRVLPENAAGLRPFGLIMKKGSPAAASAQVPGDVVPELARVIHTLARSHNRLYFRDQTPASLAALVGLAEELQPTRIVELGTCQGLSLRAWLMARTDAQITAIDLSFGALKNSLAAAPVDLSRVTLMEQNILTLDFSGSGAGATGCSFTSTPTTSPACPSWPTAWSTPCRPSPKAAWWWWTTSGTAPPPCPRTTPRRFLRPRCSRKSTRCSAFRGTTPLTGRVGPSWVLPRPSPSSPGLTGRVSP